MKTIVLSKLEILFQKISKEVHERIPGSHWEGKIEEYFMSRLRMDRDKNMHTLRQTLMHILQQNKIYKYFSYIFLYYKLPFR